MVSDAVDPAAGIGIRTHLNGELCQDGNTRDLIFSISHLLRYITAAMTLFPGDLILTGTPAGVGPDATRRPGRGLGRGPGHPDESDR